jgi:hypothetical protein
MLEALLSSVFKVGGWVWTDVKPSLALEVAVRDNTLAIKPMVLASSACSSVKSSVTSSVSPTQATFDMAPEVLRILYFSSI